MGTFNCFIGDLFRSLVSYTHQVSSFSSLHPLVINRDNATFRKSLLAWHMDFMELMVSLLAWHMDFMDLMVSFSIGKIMNNKSTWVSFFQP